MKPRRRTPRVLRRRCCGTAGWMGLAGGVGVAVVVVVVAVGLIGLAGRIGAVVGGFGSAVVGSPGSILVRIARMGELV